MTATQGSTAPRVALLTYSTKPRGGVVHTLSLAEALHREGVDVCVVGLGDPAQGFFRSVGVPVVLFPPPEGCSTLEEKVFASVDRLADGLAGLAGDVDVFHAQDCISARAAARVRDQGHGVPVVRTVHHVDDFTTAALIECQRKAIVEPDHLVVVSEQWQQILSDDYGVHADVIRNGVDPDRFPPIRPESRAALRATVGAGPTGRPLVLSIGGIEPRKGSTILFEALGLLHGAGIKPVLVVAGGHSFQDYDAYRQAALAMLPGLGLELGRDVIQAGTLTDDELGAWLRSADVLAFPSVKEGFGLVALEAMAADLPVVASSLTVFQEFLEDGVSALLPHVGDADALAVALGRVLQDDDLRRRLVDGGRGVVPRFTWATAAHRHQALYARVAGTRV